MDLKSKLKTLLKKEGQGIQRKVQKVLSPTESRISIVPPSVPIVAVTRDPDAEIRQHATDPEADEATLRSIDPLYFTSESNFDPSLHELQKQSDPLDLAYLTKSRDRIRTELTVVSKKVFQLILEKQGSYAGEIERLKSVEDDLVAAIFTCKESRVDLAAAKQEFTSKSLGVLANYRKRQVAINLLDNLRTIETLQRTEVRLQELLAEEDFSGAIQLIVELKQAAFTYSHFHCVSELSKKLQDTLENAEEQLDVALSKVCVEFDEKHYGRLQRAYQLLGKTHTCVDQLLMHYSSAIHNVAFSVIHGFAELCRVEDQQWNLQNKQYQDLCSCLSQEIFIPCLVDLCKAMWKIILSYRKLLQWHVLKAGSEIDERLQVSDLSEEYVDQKLTNGSIQIWQDIQTKIRTFLLSSELSGFKIDDFMYILSVIHSLKSVGSEFCNSTSESLQECIRESSLRYFLTYHHSKLDELRIFLENEAWEICPVRSDFDITKLAEFKFLKNSKVGTSLVHPTQRKEDARSIFETYEESGSPFDIPKDTSEENIYAIQGNQESAEKGRSDTEDRDTDDNDIDEAENEANCPFITNTTLSILRVFGRYLNLMHLLSSIAYDVAVCMSQLFEYYFYTVFVFFAAENNEITTETVRNAQLRVALLRIRDKLIRERPDALTTNGKIAQPFVSPLISLTSEDNLYGLATRIVASESSIYLASQLDTLKPFIERHIPPTSWESIAQLIDQAVIVSDGLRRPTYKGVSTRAIDYEGIIASMDKVNWEVKQLMSQHSTYVDVLLRGLQIFSMKIEAVSKYVVIPAQVHFILWEQVFHLCCRAFVEGFSNAKKCSNSGRGLMQLDFIQFLSKFEKISPVSVKGFPGRDREYVESYVKAYYNPENVMDEWIRAHNEYTIKQITNLVNCAYQGNKRTKQKLLGILEETEKDRS